MDGVSGWVSVQVDSAKQFLFERTPIFISWPVANGLDLATGPLHFPSAILHLGEGLGAYAGDPSKPENQIAAWGDVGTVCSLGLSGLLPFGSKSRIAGLVEEAQLRYPKLAGKIHKHHVWPTYLGGPRNGPVVSIDAAYHQMITNAFRNEWQYGRGTVPLPTELRSILHKVYAKYPLPK